MGAGNQQERLWIDSVPTEIGHFLSGFALGEASFMIVCRKRGDYVRKWKLSAAFNVSEKDRATLDLFMQRFDCGAMRMAGNGAWYWEVNDLADLIARVVPFFDRIRWLGRRLRTSLDSVRQCGSSSAVTSRTKVSSKSSPSGKV